MERLGSGPSVRYVNLAMMYQEGKNVPLSLRYLHEAKVPHRTSRLCHAAA